MSSIRIFCLSFLFIFSAIAWASSSIYTLKIEEETKNYIVDISYPQNFLDQHIDSKIKGLIEDMRKEFIDTENIDLPEYIGQSSLKINFKIPLKTTKILSVIFTIVHYGRGAAHENTDTITLNFINGRQVALKQLFKSRNDFIKNIASYSRTEFVKKGFSDALVTSSTEPTEDNYDEWKKKWYFNKNGLEIVFEGWQIGSAVISRQTIFIPFNILKSWSYIGPDLPVDESLIVDSIN